MSAMTHAISSSRKKKYRGLPSADLTLSNAPWGIFPDIDALRRIRKLQRRFEIGFHNPETDVGPPDAEVLAGSPEYHELERWFLRRKPFFDPTVLETYHRLLRKHMKGKTITAHVSVDPEDGWICFEFAVYGFRRKRKGELLRPEHDDFLAAVYNEGLPYRHMDSHVALRLLDDRYRPAPVRSSHVSR